MQLAVYNKEGNQVGNIELNDSIYAIKPNEDSMHLSVTVQLAHKRQGTHKTKQRGEVSGGGKKPWKQKGRGTARSGSSRSPVWVGGATFGPQPHTYDLKIPKKVNQLARRSALSIRATEQNIVVLEDFTLDQIKTKEVIKVIKNLKLDNDKTVFITTNYDKNLYFSTRNLEKANILPVDQLSCYDILNHKKIVLFKGAVEKLENILI